MLKKLLTGVIYVAALAIYTYAVFIVSATYAVKHFEERQKKETELRKNLDQRVKNIEDKQEQYYYQ